MISLNFPQIFIPLFFFADKAERKSSRSKNYVDYSYKNDIATHGWAKISDILAKRAFLADKFVRVHGKQLTIDYIGLTGFKEPIIIEEPEGEFYFHAYSKD